MIQDIAPHRLDNAYAPKAPRPEDALLFFSAEGRLYVSLEDGEIRFPNVGTMAAGAVYLFSLDGTGYYLAPEGARCPDASFVPRLIRELRDEACGEKLYAAFTAYHLWKWYRDNRHCGRCGAGTALHPAERALQCPACGQVIYPRINPAVIVGVIKDDSLLITRYRRGYAHNALVAGFTEIGETLEETVAREVMEETGVHIKNIRYYKSQPWGMAQDILMGFYCDADGDAVVRPDGDELKYAQWVRREDIVLQPNDLSLTNEMMRLFKEGGPIPPCPEGIR